LTRDVGSFSLYDVFAATEEKLLLTACLRKGFACPMNEGGAPCGVHREFVRLQEMLFAGLKEKTISEVLGLAHDADARVSG
ncbi:MAG: hypothetical protein LBB57_01450, partial [Clostridiales Family XIII bacterium]|nr:hypothetical protein [Clostridiales Family XIII bacterium]